MSNTMIDAEIRCLERALKNKIDFLKFNDKPLTREEVAATLQVMSDDIIHALNILSKNID